MFRKFVCIYLIVYSSIGSNGPFPLPKYCALPIASLDLIVCIYCLNHMGKKCQTVLTACLEISLVRLVVVLADLVYILILFYPF